MLNCHKFNFFCQVLQMTSLSKSNSLGFLIDHDTTTKGMLKRITIQYDLLSKEITHHTHTELMPFYQPLAMNFYNRFDNVEDIDRCIQGRIYLDYIKMIRKKENKIRSLNVFIKKRNRLNKFTILREK